MKCRDEIRSCVNFSHTASEKQSETLSKRNNEETSCAGFRRIITSVKESMKLIIRTCGTRCRR